MGSLASSVEPQPWQQQPSTGPPLWYPSSPCSGASDRLSQASRPQLPLEAVVASCRHLAHDSHDVEGALTACVGYQLRFVDTLPKAQALPLPQKMALCFTQRVLLHSSCNSWSVNGHSWCKKGSRRGTACVMRILGSVAMECRAQACFRCMSWMVDFPSHAAYVAAHLLSMKPFAFSFCISLGSLLRADLSLSKPAM
eukprot:309538-Pelagomonas_calceolata.AAC.2